MQEKGDVDVQSMELRQKTKEDGDSEITWRTDWQRSVNDDSSASYAKNLTFYFYFLAVAYRFFTARRHSLLCRALY